MIEKLKTPKDWLPSVNSDKEIRKKINELVDAVNSIVSVQEKLIDSRFVVETKHEEPAENVQPDTESRQENVQNIIRKPLDVHDIKSYMVEFSAENSKCAKNTPDPYAEPTNWIGKLCRFWDVCKENAYIGILSEITISGHYFPKNAVFSYGNCEPVSPDDDIIYKGE